MAAFISSPARRASSIRWRERAPAKTSVTRRSRWTSASGQTRPAAVTNARPPTTRPPATSGSVRPDRRRAPSCPASSGNPSGCQTAAGSPRRKPSTAHGKSRPVTTGSSASSIPAAVQEYRTAGACSFSASRNSVRRSSPKNSPSCRSHVSMAGSISRLGRWTNAPEKRASRFSKRSRSSRASWARRRSSMTLARARSGMAMTLRKICSARTLSAAGSVVNGPCPRVPAQIARSAVVRSARLTPPGPNRTAAHRKKGRTKASGVRGDPGMRPGIPAAPAKATSPTATSARVRSAASRCRRGGAVRTHLGPAVIPMTSAGTSVSSVRTLEKKRVRQTSQ